MGNAIEFEGKVYELGKHYWFYDEDEPASGVTICVTGVYDVYCCGSFTTIEDAIANGWLDAGTITEANQEPKAGQYWLVRSTGGQEYPLKVQSDGMFADKDVTPIRELK